MAVIAVPALAVAFFLVVHRTPQIVSPPALSAPPPSRPRRATNTVVLGRRPLRPRGSAPGTRTRSPTPTIPRSGSKRRGRPTRRWWSSRAAGHESSRCEAIEHPPAVLDYVCALPRGSFLTVIPQLFEHPSLVSAVARNDDVLAETPPAVRAGDRRHERPARGARRRAGASAASGARSWSPRSTPPRFARSTTRRTLASRTRPRSSSRSTPMKRSASSETGSGKGWDSARDRRGAVPRPGRPLRGYLEGTHRRPGARVSGRDARARFQRRAQAAAQPAGALHQALSCSSRASSSPASPTTCT